MCPLSIPILQISILKTTMRSPFVFAQTMIGLILLSVLIACPRQSVPAAVRATYQGAPGLVPPCEAITLTLDLNDSKLVGKNVSYFFQVTFAANQGIRKTVDHRTQVGRSQEISVGLTFIYLYCFDVFMSRLFCKKFSTVYPLTPHLISDILGSVRLCALFHIGYPQPPKR